MVNIGTRVAPVNIAFSSSRNAVLIERKMLQYTTLSIKLHHCTLNEIKLHYFTMSHVLSCASVHCADQRQQSIPDFLKKIDNTLQTWIDIAKEYLQEYNMGGRVKNHLFWSLHELKRAVYTSFLLTNVLSNYFLELKFSLFS